MKDSFYFYLEESKPCSNRVSTDLVKELFYLSFSLQNKKSFPCISENSYM